MARNLIVLLLASVAAVGLFASPNAAAAPTEELKALTVDQVAARIAAKDGKTFIYDDNSKESWAAGHVPGATWLDDDHVTAADLPADKSATLIFYCHNEG
jgi:rhodanese-related sulfurtransferase